MKSMPPEPSSLWSVRNGVPADGASLKKLHRAAILGAVGAGYSQEELESWSAGLEAKRYADDMTSGGTRFLVAVEPGTEIVGFCSFRQDEVRGLYVDPGWSRCGIGGYLLSAAETAIAQDGHKCCRLEAVLPSVLFYRSRGYREVADRNYPTRGGLDVRVFDMVRDLD